MATDSANAKQILNLQKQNEGIISSLKAKNVPFEYEPIEDTLEEEVKLIKLKELNIYLKDLSTKNRPPPQEKPVKQEKPANPVKPSNNDEDDDEPTKEVKPTFSTITNMEDIKRAFFNREYEQAAKLISEHPFKIYEANYKYASDNTGKPDFVARNLLRGFIQGLDDYRKYLMVCFRCILTDKDSKAYDYPSYWIVNSNDDLKIILGSLYDDYDFTLVETEEDKTKMLKIMEKLDQDTNDNLIGESYLH